MICRRQRNEGGLWSAIFKMMANLWEKAGLWERSGPQKKAGVWEKTGLKERAGLWEKAGLKRVGVWEMKGLFMVKKTVVELSH